MEAAEKTGHPTAEELIEQAQAGDVIEAKEAQLGYLAGDLVMTLALDATQAGALVRVLRAVDLEQDEMVRKMLHDEMDVDAALAQAAIEDVVRLLSEGLGIDEPTFVDASNLTAEEVMAQEG